MATDSGTGDVTDRFSLVGGGPFDALLDRFGLIGDDQLPTWRAAVVMALLAWTPPAALAVMQALLDSLPAFKAALDVADRRSSSALAELIILAVALIWSGIAMTVAVDLAQSSWEGRVFSGEGTLSWAGEAARFFSNPLFLFLVFRWIWRFALWTRLLHRISRLPFQLTPLHPDRAAGLAVFQLVIAAGVPLLVVVATQVPIGDILIWILGRIF